MDINEIHELVEISENNGVCTISINEDMTIYTASKIKKTLFDALPDCLSNNKNTELNLSDVSEMDTAGFQILLLCKKEAIRTDASLKVVSPSNSVKEVLGVYQMTSFFEDEDVGLDRVS